MAQYNYTKTGVDLQLLRVEVNDNETVGQDVDYINFTYPDDLSVFFASDLSVEEKTELDAVVVAHDVSQGGQFKPTHKKIFPQRGNPDKVEYYENCDEVGNLSGLSRRTLYDITGNKLAGITDTEYFKDGTIKSQEVISCLTIGGNLIEKKVV